MIQFSYSSSECVTPIVVIWGPVNTLDEYVILADLLEPFLVLSREEYITS